MHLGEGSSPGSTSLLPYFHRPHHPTPPTFSKEAFVLLSSFFSEVEMSPDESSPLPGDHLISLAPPPHPRAQGEGSWVGRTFPLTGAANTPSTRPWASDEGLGKRTRQKVEDRRGKAGSSGPAATGPTRRHVPGVGTQDGATSPSPAGSLTLYSRLLPQGGGKGGNLSKSL